MSTLTPESLCNQALDMIGYKGRRISHMYDGSSPASRVALEAFAFTRDQLLNLDMPYWAQRNVVLTLVSTSPDNYTTEWAPPLPPIDYKYMYNYPTDCVQPLFIISTPVFRPIWKPKYIPFDVFSATPDSRFIVTNGKDAILVYTGQVVDPNLWQEDFTLKFISALAEKFRAKLGVQIERNTNNPG